MNANSTKAKLLQAGLDVLSSDGLGGLSLGRVAQAAGLSKSGLFAHVRSMEEVVETASLRDAIRKRLKLRLLYCAENGERTERVVWPVVLGYSDTKRVLIAWCEMRQGFRHFRTDRMQAAELLDQPIGEPRGPLLRRWEASRSAELAEAGRRS